MKKSIQNMMDIHFLTVPFVLFLICRSDLKFLWFEQYVADVNEYTDGYYE